MRSFLTFISIICLIAVCSQNSSLSIGLLLHLENNYKYQRTTQDFGVPLNYGTLRPYLYESITSHEERQEKYVGNHPSTFYPHTSLKYGTTEVASHNKCKNDSQTNHLQIFKRKEFHIKADFGVNSTINADKKFLSLNNTQGLKKLFKRGVRKRRTKKKTGKKKRKKLSKKATSTTIVSTSMNINTLLETSQNTNADMITQAQLNSNESIFTDESKEDEYLINDEQFSEDKLSASSFDMTDGLINYESSCDQIDQNECWYERQVGDTLTLGVNITGFDKSSSTFFVQWKKMYYRRLKKNMFSMVIEADHLPWNMVLGSGNKELRLNPITNIDIDPNSLIAKVYRSDLSKKIKAYDFVTELRFKIDIPSIDMGKIYYGEELNINIENFISLPENGNFILDWGTEKSQGKTESLSSNVKVSSSGRSIVIKELKKGQLGVISCVVFSSKGIAVAKRRFRIKKLDNSIQRRSLIKGENRFQSRIVSFQECSQDRYKRRMIAQFMKPISRKKRFRKSFQKNRNQFSRIKECVWRKSRQRLHPRWAPFGLSDTTLDPRLIPIEKLMALSEDSDGTLDDIIPHEIHFVEPLVRIITDNILEYARYAYFKPNCSDDKDCGIGALCIVPKGKEHKSMKREEDKKGYCYCKPEYYGDGFSCQKIPIDNHRDKRIKRYVSKYEADSEISHEPLRYMGTNNPLAIEVGGEQTQSPFFGRSKDTTGQEYEEEESNMLSDCLTRKDCSQHAICHRSDKIHSFCKCRSGYRGNGIFCWEIMDYIPRDTLDIDLSEK